MAVPKVMGLETEFGAHVYGRSAEGTPGRVEKASDGATTAIVELAGILGEAWTPSAAIRRFSFPNGGLLYRDVGDHPEYATPECLTAQELVAHDRAGEVILAAALREFFERPRVRNRYPDVTAIGLYKHNVDFSGNTFGTHENFCVAADRTFADYAWYLAPFLSTRPIFAGSGGLRWPSDADEMPAFTLSPRAAFMQGLIGNHSTSNRPMVLRRPEPHADPTRFKRLQLLCGDANRCELANLLKMGTTAIVLAMIEDGFAPRDLEVVDPVHALSVVAGDTTLTATLEVGGRSMTALDVQFAILAAAERYGAATGLEACGGPAGKLVLQHWRTTLEALEGRRYEQLFGKLDWVTRQQLFARTVERGETAANTVDIAATRTRLAATELSYSSIGTDGAGIASASTFESLRARGHITILGSVDPQVTDAGPVATRAGFRGELVRSARRSLVSLDWAHVQVQAGGESFIISLPDPVLSDGRELVALAAQGSGEMLDRMAELAPIRFLDLATNARGLGRLRICAQVAVRRLQSQDRRASARDALMALGQAAFDELGEAASPEDRQRIVEHTQFAVEVGRILGNPEAVQIWLDTALERVRSSRVLETHTTTDDEDQPYAPQRPRTELLERARAGREALHVAGRVLRDLAPESPTRHGPRPPGTGK